jgi:hypothetical protein
VAAPPCPVTDPDDLERRRGSGRPRPDQSQQCIADDRHRQLARQSRPRLAAEAEADLLPDLAPL